MNKEIFIISSINNKKINLKKPSNEGISLYVCGITPYDYAHIGHARCYIAYDVLIRLTRTFKYQIKYCRNITDIDDKIINKSINLYNNGNRFKEIADYYYKLFLNDLSELNCLRPDYEPKVSENINNIIIFIEDLIKKNYAYYSNGDVYFSISKCKDYGCLSKRDLKEQISKNKVKKKSYKKNALDFALWKKSSYNEPGWDSPWSFGRPGWHIECSVMAKEAFGDTIDIHGGGLDLIFPHHENEKCQSESLSEKQFVSIWMHVAHVNINNQKMSKSLNNFFTIKEICEKHDPMVFRYYVLSHHYRTPIEFKEEDLKSFKKSYITLINLFENIEIEIENNYEHEILNKIYDSICNDLNISESIGYIFKYKKVIEENINLKKECKKFLKIVCGLSLNKIKNKDNVENEYTEEVLSLLKEREEARKNKDFKRSDEIRDLLKSLNININDNKL